MTAADPTRRFYTIAEDTLLDALEDAAAGDHPGVLVADLYARAANPLDPAVAATTVVGSPALLAHLDGRRRA